MLSIRNRRVQLRILTGHVSQIDISRRPWGLWGAYLRRLRDRAHGKGRVSGRIRSGSAQRSLRAVEVFAVREFDKHAWVVADRSGVMTRWQQRHLILRKISLDPSSMTSGKALANTSAT